MNIYDFGWTDKFSTEKVDPTNIARITTVHKAYCRAISLEGNINIYLTGKYRNENSLNVVTGDFVQMGPRFTDEQNKAAAKIETLFPRKTKLSRVAAGNEVKEQILVANVDYVFIVTSANNDFSVNRLQRYLLMAEQGDVTPIIVLSKKDLVDSTQEFIQEITEQMSQVQVMTTSISDKASLEPLHDLLKTGVTAAFVGSSGVGKSSLVNELLNTSQQKVKEIRADDGKGRHTTTGREMFFLKNGGMIIDTPGLREVEVFANEDSLRAAFEDLRHLIEKCKFSDCTHDNEPGCAVKSALESGDLSPEKYESLLKLQKEARHNDSRINHATGNTKERWKKINKNYKARRKFEGKD